MRSSLISARIVAAAAIAWDNQRDMVLYGAVAVAVASEQAAAVSRALAVSAASDVVGRLR